MITLIIPTYNSPYHLELAIKSAILGAKSEIEILVSIDGPESHQVNKNILEMHSKNITQLIHPENIGLSNSTNLAVMNAKYENIYIINDDNVMPMGWDVNVLPFINNKILISPNQIEPYPSMFKQFVYEDLGTDPKIFDLARFHKYEQRISQNSQEESGWTLPIAMKRLDFLSLGGWDPNYPTNGIVADWDFFLKAKINNYKSIRLYNSHVYHFVSGTIKSIDEMKKRRETEEHAHNYATYKWGTNIKHNSLNNSKYL